MPRPSQRNRVVAAMPGTLGEIADKSGVQLGTVVRWLRIMRDLNECYVSGWKRTTGATGGPIKRVYSMGFNKVDVPCNLKRSSDRDYCRTYRRKLHQDVDAHSLRKAKQRAAYWTSKAKKEGDPLVAALFGRRPAANQGDV